jgi:ATP-binding cassette subfamily F protein 3
MRAVGRSSRTVKLEWIQATQAHKLNEARRRTVRTRLINASLSILARVGSHRNFCLVLAPYHEKNCPRATMRRLTHHPIKIQVQKCFFSFRLLLILFSQSNFKGSQRNTARTMADSSTRVLDACTALLPNLDPDILSYIVGILEDVNNDDTTDKEETVETISGFLASADYCSEDEAEQKAKALLTKMTQTRMDMIRTDVDLGATGSTDGGGNHVDADGYTGECGATQMKAMSLGKKKSGGAGAGAAKGKGKIQDAKKKEAPVAVAVAVAVAATPVRVPVVVEKTEAEVEKAVVKADNKAEKLALKAEKKAARKARPKKNAKLSASEQAEAQALEIDAELSAARVAAVRSKVKLGAYKGALDAKSFTLPNPGGGQPLLEDAACRLVWGRRYGLIGRNGMGKSTLLRAFAARRVGDVPPNVLVHYVSQEVILSEAQRLKTPVEVVVDADIERTLLMEEHAELEVKAAAGELDAKGSQRHGMVLMRLDEIEADSAHRRATSLLKNLGFSSELQARPLSQLSGGWRVRTMLAAAIFAKPDLLLLDEPTNHLSILAVMWLARELATSETWKQRIVVIVSHDRHFMDEVCSDCLHISGAAHRLTQCRGNYSTWAKRRKEEQALFAKEQAARQSEIDTLREYAGHGFKYGGSASQINKMGMKAKQADKLEEVHAEHSEELAALQEDVELPMKIDAGGELDGYVVQLVDVGFGYPNATPARLFEHCEIGITSKSRIVLLGENGNGKTTLVKLIMGELEATEGEVKRSPHARYALVNQHHADQIDLALTPLQFLQKQFPGDGSYEHMQILRGHLSSCGVTSGSSSGTMKISDLQNTPASALSGGQRSRVALAAVSFAKPHVLVLDEPTNNLDLESVATLAESVQKFKGAVICVSHDQFFVQAVANEAWVVNGGKVRQVASFDTYRNAQLKVLNKS